MVKVTLWGGLIPLADNQKHIEVDAANIRELLRKLAEKHPGLSGPIANEIAVVIDGVVYRDNWSKELAKDGEVFLMRRISGG